ncbi:hypothetical protein HK097_008571 [Rhizophlyctis rosea]|uniref:Zn(2)-C6 fungal-type domain-containing protein n=1 Tax=Rhizophlyctis rosea TaxID=64517 RepID=A0AAD5SPZ7_9FUNG|nr:hypothetical protein HK097_008571 [Rhizophlyctis rosea]
MAQLEAEAQAPYTHFFRDLPDNAVHEILRVYVSKDILLRCDTASYACLCTVDRFFRYTMHLTVNENLMILQAKREEYLASFPHHPDYTRGIDGSRKHVRSLLQNPYFDYGTYISSVLSTFDDENWKWRTHMFQYGNYFAQAAPFLSYKVQPKTSTFITEGHVPDPATNELPTFTYTFHAHETLEFRSNSQSGIRCLFFKKFVYTPPEEDPTNVSDAEIRACEFLCILIHGELRPDEKEPETVPSFRQLFRSTSRYKTLLGLVHPSPEAAPKIAMSTAGLIPALSGNTAVDGFLPIQSLLTTPTAATPAFSTPIYPIRRPTPISVLLAFRQMAEDPRHQMSPKPTTTTVDDQVSELFRSFTDEDFEYSTEGDGGDWERDTETSSVTAAWRSSYSPSLTSQSGSDDSFTSSQMLELHNEPMLGCALLGSDDDSVLLDKAWDGFGHERLEEQVTCIAPQVLETGGLSHGCDSGVEPAFMSYVAQEQVEVNPKAEAGAQQSSELTGCVGNLLCDPSSEAAKASNTFRLPPGIVRRCVEHDTPRKVYVHKACTNCKASHVACDTSRPCQRCTKLGKADQCADTERKKRGRPCNIDPPPPPRKSSTLGSNASISSPCLGGINGCEESESSSSTPPRPTKRHRPILPLVPTQVNALPYLSNITTSGVTLPAPATETSGASVADVRTNDLYRSVPTVAYLIPYTTSAIDTDGIPTLFVKQEDVEGALQSMGGYSGLHGGSAS